MKNAKLNKKNNTFNKPNKLSVDNSAYIIRSKTVRISLTLKQQKKINDWIAATRKVWNKSLHFINLNRLEKHSGITVRDKFVIKKKMNSKTLKEMSWTLRTPKRIREYAVKDLFANMDSFKTNYKQKIFAYNKKKKLFDSGKIKKRPRKPCKPKLNPKNKYDFRQTISLPKEGSRIFTEERNIGKKRKICSILRVCGEDVLLLENIQETNNIICNMRLTREGFNYFISIPEYVDKEIIPDNNKNEKVTGIDTGINIPFTYIDPEGEYGFIGADLRCWLERMYKKIDSCIVNVRTSKRKSVIKKIELRIRNKVDDFQWKTCIWLLHKYNKIIIPRLYVRRCSKDLLRLQNDMRHCTFVNRLIYKSIYYENREIHECKEHGTSMTCTNCGSINTVKHKTVFCNDCSFEIHRDLAGSRNILIKHLETK